MRSENHPVGFKKFILLRFSGYRLRLHVWPPGAGNDSRHNHRWWFISVPLYGRFLETRYVETTGYSMLRISVEDVEDIRDGDRRYRKVGESLLIPTRQRVRYPFVPYFCPVGAIHSLIPYRSGWHASLVLTAPISRRQSEIWRSEDQLDVDLSEG